MRLVGENCPIEALVPLARLGLRWLRLRNRNSSDLVLEETCPLADGSNSDTVPDIKHDDLLGRSAGGTFVRALGGASLPALSRAVVSPEVAITRLLMLGCGLVLPRKVSLRLQR